MPYSVSFVLFYPVKGSRPVWGAKQRPASNGGFLLGFELSFKFATPTAKMAACREDGRQGVVRRSVLRVQRLRVRLRTNSPREPSISTLQNSKVFLFDTDRGVFYY